MEGQSVNAKNIFSQERRSHYLPSKGIQLTLQANRHSEYEVRSTFEVLLGFIAMQEVSPINNTVASLRNKRPATGITLEQVNKKLRRYWLKCE
jgi:hypothetical protein